MQDSVTEQNLRQTLAGFYRRRTCVMMRCYLISGPPGGLESAHLGHRRLH